MQAAVRRNLVAVAIALAAVQPACSHTEYRAKFTPATRPAAVDRSEQFLKCHMRNGELYVLDHWTIPEGLGLVRGAGIHYDAERQRLSQGAQEVRLSDVELLETNDPESVTHSGVAVMAVVTGVSLAVTALCVANPKACFGSCPTFFADDGEKMAIQAEGFSASIARSLEATDIDPLWTARPHAGSLDLLMTNEALETHLVDSVRVLAVPRPPGGRVVHEGERFFPATNFRGPSSCRSQQGDCLEAVASVDQKEYSSPTDGVDLSTKETVVLEFPRAEGASSLVIAGRNTLLNTFLLYQALAYMGRSAGEWYMRINRSAGGKFEGVSELGRLLGDVEVAVRRPDGEFEPVGRFSEVGPIAREVQAIPIPGTSTVSKEPLVVRLTMTRGNWRIDHVALATIGDAVEPVPLDPVSVSRKGAPDARALAQLLAPGDHLVTYPGDSYSLRFSLPPGDQELFLESRGYYYEWIRDSWLKEQSQLTLLRMLMDPAGTLRRLAPAYKKIEADMDRIFWQSRVGVK